MKRFKKYNIKTKTSLKIFEDLINPKYYVERICNLRGPQELIISHKKIKRAAQFQEPNKIILDFRNNRYYIALSIAHEYAHLILRYNHWNTNNFIRHSAKRYKLYQSLRLKNDFLYSIEQSIAILVQVAYEKYVGFKKSNAKHIQELMKFMDVWKVGRWYLRYWQQYYIKNHKNFHSKKFRNILFFIQFVAKKIVLLSYRNRQEISRKKY